MRNLELPGFSEIPTREDKPEETLRPEPHTEKIISMWGEVQEQLLDAEISEIFPLPEFSVLAKTIFAFSELTQITPEWLSPEYGYGRKMVCKYIISPFFKEQLMVKETKGEVPVYYFAYPDDEPQNLYTGRPMWSPKPLAEKGKDEEKEFAEFLDRVLEDTRKVRLSRIHTGTNVRGKEYETIFYFEPKNEEELRLTTILHEEASPRITQTENGADFALRGCVFNLSDEGLVRAATYRTLQLHSWNGATATLGGYYENGILRGILITEHKEDTLPIAKAMAEEEPNSLLEPRLRIDTESLSSKPQCQESDYFTKHNLYVEINQPSPKTLLLAVKKKGNPEAVQVLTSIPLVLNSQECLDSIRGESLLPIKQEVGCQLPLETKTIEEELKLIRVDPEIDIDLNVVLNRLTEVYGNSLQELILYGSIARGQKRLRSDIDILAIVDNDANTTPERIEGLERGALFHEALGSYRSLGITQKMKNIEVHTIRHSDFEKPQSPALEDFLDNIKVGTISLWKREEDHEINGGKNLGGK